MDNDEPGMRLPLSLLSASSSFSHFHQSNHYHRHSVKHSMKKSMTGVIIVREVQGKLDPPGDLAGV